MAAEATPALFVADISAVTSKRERFSQAPVQRRRHRYYVLAPGDAAARVTALQVLQGSVGSEGLRLAEAPVVEVSALT